MNARKVGITRLGYGTSFINLGQTAPGMDRPEIVYPTGVRPENSVVTWAKDLLNIARTEAYTPPVLYGVGGLPAVPHAVGGMVTVEPGRVGKPSRHPPLLWGAHWRGGLVLAHQPIR